MKNLYAERALRAGASAYITKHHGVDEVLVAHQADGLRLKKRWRNRRAQIVIAAGPVMTEPSNGLALRRRGP